MYSEILSAKQGGTTSPATYQTHYPGQDPRNSQQAQSPNRSLAHRSGPFIKELSNNQRISELTQDDSSGLKKPRQSFYLPNVRMSQQSSNIQSKDGNLVSGEVVKPSKKYTGQMEREVQRLATSQNMNGNVERVEHYPVSSLKDDGSSILLESLSVTKLPVAPEIQLT